MRLFLLIWFGAGLLASAQESQPLEARTSPFDFDNFRRTPIQARQDSSAWASRDPQGLQRSLLSGTNHREQDIAARAAALFPDPASVPIREESQPLPTPNELTDQITAETHGQTTKGQRDLLARGRVAHKLDLASMSGPDYEWYVAQRRSGQAAKPVPSSEGLLRPMPTLTNPKTGGPPHAYAVSQAGIGARAEPRDDQNPFEDLIRVLRLDRPVTRGSDPLPSPSGRLAVAPPPVTEVEPIPETGNEPLEAADPQP